jgi:ribonuclease PH
MRDDGRRADQMRPITIETGYQSYPDGSVLITCGMTKVICSAYAEAGVPRWMAGTGQGWVTAEYAMLPGAGQTRTRRERNAGGRSQEIQRLIGRSLRAVTDLRGLGDQTIQIDCDVLQADGGTRTASITGAYVALVLALARLRGMGLVNGLPVSDFLTAISCGVVDGEPRLDLHYSEDSRAEVDMNVVMTGRGHLVEVQGTAEGEPYERTTLNRLIDLAEKGCGELMALQKQALGSLADEIAARH